MTASPADSVGLDGWLNKCVKPRRGRVRLTPKFQARPAGWVLVLFVHTGTREESTGLERKLSLDFDFLNFEMLALKTKGNKDLEFRLVPHIKSSDPNPEEQRHLWGTLQKEKFHVHDARCSSF